MPELSESQWNRIKDTLLEQAHQCATGAKKRCVRNHWGDGCDSQQRESKRKASAG
jgi:hypothetical protein